MKEKNELRTSVSLHILRRKALAFALAFALVLSTILTMVPMLEVKAEETWEYPTSAPSQPFAAGSGTEADPYQISTAQQLANLAWLSNDWNGSKTYLDKYYILTDNIDLGNKEWSKEISWSYDFKGVFDGGGHTVCGLYINTTGNYAGLFAKTEGAVIKNLTVSGRVVGKDHAGGIVGKADTDSVIRNCTNLCEVSGNYYVGGICGDGWDASIYNCENIGNITGVEIGGICGENYSSDKDIYILDCSNYGDITYDNGNYGGQAGGICGSFSGKSCSCSGCYNSGNVTCKYGTAGGIIGNFSGTIEKCYNTGTIKVLGYSSGAYVGGIVGEMHKNISNCYNRGGVIYEGTDNYAEIGGIAGGCYPSSNNVYSNCYNMGTVQGSSNSTRIGGIVGKLSYETVTFNNNYSLSGTNSYLIAGSSTTATNQYEFLTTDEFTLAGKFNSWDFENIWVMNASNTYPVLRGVGEAEGSYTVTFNSNGGTTVAEQSVIKNKRARVPNAPIKDGYAFIGWCSDEGLNTLYDFSTAVTENKTLYAKWQLYVPDVSATGYNGEYDGNNHGITVTAPTGATITYGETEGSYATDNPSYTNVGENTVYYQVTKDGYAPVTGSATVTITEKEIGISWTDTALTYNGSEQKPTATATGLIGSDTCTITVTGEETNANAYTATAGSIDNANYKLPTANTTTFTISPAKIIVSGIKANNKAYDGNVSATLDYSNVSLAGKIAGDDLSVSATGVFEDYKPATDITVSITDLTLEGTSAGNYVLATLGQQTTTTADITINNDIVVEEVTNPDGSITKTETKYEGGNVSKITETTTSEDGNTVTVVEKNPSNEILKTTVTVNNADGTKTITETNVDESSKVTEKDSAGNITKETVTNSDGSKVVTENSYDNLGNKTGSVVTTISADGKTVTVKEKDASDVTTKTTETVTNADGTKTVTTTEGNTTTVETKDSEDNVTKTVETVKNEDESTTITEKDADGNITKETVINADGSSKVTEKDADGKVTKETVTDADGSKEVTENSYDNAGDKTGSVVTTTSADGKTVTVEEKDASDNTKKTTVTEKDSSDTVVKTTVTVNNSDGTKTITETNADGSSKVTEKNSTEKVTKETVTNADESKVETENSYDSEGNKTGSVVTTTSADGKTVTVETMDNNDITTKTVKTVTNADGTETVTTTEGNTTTVDTKDSDGNTTKTVETVTNSDGTKTVKTTDGDSTTVEKVDQNGETTSVVKQESNDQGTAVKTVEEIGDAPDTTLIDDVDVLVDKLIFDEEKVRQQNGELVMIILDVEDVTDSASSEDIAKVVAALQSGEKAGGYFEINLYKQIGASSKIQITDTNNEKISISMRIPDELINNDDKVERTYRIVRLHDGKVDIIDSKTDLAKQLITFETDKFSIYAITYIDKIINNQDTKTEVVPKVEEDVIDVEPDEPVATVDMFRLYNPNSGEHFYTSNVAEKDNLVKLGWRYEGIGWKAPAKSNTPVYRLYNKNAGDHFYTMNEKEKDNLVRLGWKYEGIGWYSDDAQSVPLYRQYNPNAKAGSHNFTTSKDENDFLKGLGWKEEGIGWYGVK